MCISIFIESEEDAEKNARSRSKRLEKPRTFFGDSSTTDQEERSKNFAEPKKRKRRITVRTDYIIENADMFIFLIFISLKYFV